MLSNLSSTPPCSQNNLPESFTFASRLKLDSMKSPICPKVPIIKPSSNNIEIGKSIFNASPSNQNDKIPLIKPAMPPSQLFFGLI